MREQYRRYRITPLSITKHLFLTDFRALVERNVLVPIAAKADQQQLFGAPVYRLILCGAHFCAALNWSGRIQIVRFPSPRKQSVEDSRSMSMKDKYLSASSDNVRVIDSAVIR